MPKNSNDGSIGVPYVYDPLKQQRYTRLKSALKEINQEFSKLGDSPALSGLKSLEKRLKKILNEIRMKKVNIGGINQQAESLLHSVEEEINEYKNGFTRFTHPDLSTPSKVINLLLDAQVALEIWRTDVSNACAAFAKQVGKYSENLSQEAFKKLFTNSRLLDRANGTPHGLFYSSAASPIRDAIMKGRVKAMMRVVKKGNQKELQAFFHQEQKRTTAYSYGRNTIYLTPLFDYLSKSEFKKLKDTFISVELKGLDSFLEDFWYEYEQRLYYNNEKGFQSDIMKQIGSDPNIYTTTVKLLVEDF